MSEVERAYQEALDYLNRFIDYEKGMPRTYSPVTFNLARTARLLDALGAPHEEYDCLLIAGTKGKGSTAAFLESILRTAGYRTGLYTSPHLHTWRERVQVDRQLIPKTAVVAQIERMRPIVEEMSRPPAEQGAPTYYEISTALALDYFAAQDVRFAVLEVGLGGRYDATNVVRPRLSIVSTIGYDHMEILGNTLAEIAGEKAGIVKPAGWAVSAPQEREAMAVLEAVCRERGARLWVAEPEVIQQTEPEMAQRPYPIAMEPASLSLQGFFQRTNARLAAAAVRALIEQGWVIPPAAVEEGLRTTRWPARLEVVGRFPWLVLDGAHNVDSARALQRALRETFRYRRLILILGFSHGHDAAAFAREIGQEAARLIVTASRHPRAVSAEVAAERIRQAVTAPLELAPSVAEALERARQIAAPDDLICVCGSLFVAGEARQACGLVEEVD